MKAKSLFIAALAVAALSACSKDEGQNVGSERPIFSGVINGVNTRAVDREWQAGNTIGIIAGDGTTQFNVPYKVSAKTENGSFTPKGDKYISFTSNKPETFIAYFPYSSKMTSVSDTYYIPDEDDATSTVVTTDADHQGENIDFLWSSAVGSSLNPDVNFVFRHVMSEITLNFTKGTGVNSLEGLEFTLSGLNLNGKFNVMTGETQLEGSDTEEIKLAVGDDVTDNTETATKTAIFFPQNVSTIELTVSLGSSNYSATLQLPKATNNQLLAGYNVEFNITVNISSLSTASGSVIGWNTQQGSYATVITKLGDRAAEGAKLYDLAMSDGTFITVLKDGDVDVSDLSDDQLANVVGIVYWLSTTGDNAITPLTDDKILETDHSDCTHGYILALKDMVSGGTVWQGSEESIFETFQSKDGNSMNPDAGGSYQSIVIENDDTNQLQKALGYNNTKVLRAYNYYFADANHKVLPIKYLDEFAAENDAPKGSSGWYLPSPKELVLINNTSEGLTTNIEFTHNYGKQQQLTDIKNILNSLSGKGIAEDFSNFYWSSSEYSYTSSKESRYYAWSVEFDYDYGYVSYYGRNTYGYVRAVCAF
jgi:hypothetical protein